jgi:chaperone BCS1
VKVEYKKATSEQAAALFNRFFPPSRFSSASTPDKDTSPESSTNRYARKTPLSQSLPELCQAFASALPKDEFTTAELQGYLLKCKWDPEQAVEKLGAWVEELREEAKQRAAREEEAKKKRRRAKKKAAKKAAKEAAKAAASGTSTPATSDAEES